MHHCQSDTTADRALSLLSVSFAFPRARERALYVSLDLARLSLTLSRFSLTCVCAHPLSLSHSPSPRAAAHERFRLAARMCVEASTGWPALECRAFNTYSTRHLLPEVALRIRPTCWVLAKERERDQWLSLRLLYGKCPARVAKTPNFPLRGPCVCYKKQALLRFGWWR